MNTPGTYRVHVASRFPPEWERPWQALGQVSGHILQHPAWAQLKQRFGWVPRWVALADGDDFVAAAQVLFRRFAPGMTIAYIPRGPMLARQDDTLWHALLRALDELCHQQGAIALKVEPDWSDTSEARALLRESGFRPAFHTVQPRSTLHVDLTLPEQDILARMKSKWRYNIRLARRKGVTVRPATREEVPVFVDLLTETARRDGFAIHTPAYYYHAWEALTAAEVAVLFLAWYEGTPLAGLFVAAWGPVAVYLYGASGQRERQRMPNHLLQWEAMCWAKARGCRVYDLWGIPDEVGAHPERWANRTPQRTDGLWGVYRFKQGFGGHIVRTVGAWDRVYRPLSYRAYAWGWTLWQRRRSLGDT